MREQFLWCSGPKQKEFKKPDFRLTQKKKKRIYDESCNFYYMN